MIYGLIVAALVPHAILKPSLVVGMASICLKIKRDHIIHSCPFVLLYIRSSVLILY